MRLATFHQLRSAMQSNGSPAATDRLTSVAGQLCDLLAPSPLFDWFEVGVTDDPDRLVIAMCQVDPDRSDIVVAQTLEAMWANGLLQPHWGANATIVEDGHVELEGATLADEQGRYVTVHVLAARPRFPEQRQPAGSATAQTSEASRTGTLSFGGSTNR